MGCRFDPAVQAMLDHGVGGRLFDRLSLIARRAGAVSVEGLLVQLLFASECSVEAGPADPYGLGEIGDRSAEITVAPKQAHGAVERFVEVEVARSAGSAAWRVHSEIGPCHCSPDRYRLPF